MPGSVSFFSSVFCDAGLDCGCCWLRRHSEQSPQRWFVVETRAESLPGQQRQALRNWCSGAAASAAQAWQDFQPGSGLLYLEANVRLLPAEFRDAFGLATPAAADLQQNYRTAVLAALQTALDWYEQVVPA